MSQTFPHAEMTAVCRSGLWESVDGTFMRNRLTVWTSSGCYVTKYGCWEPQKSVTDTSSHISTNKTRPWDTACSFRKIVLPCSKWTFSINMWWSRSVLEIKSPFWVFGASDHRVLNANNTFKYFLLSLLISGHFLQIWFWGLFRVNILKWTQ